MNRQQRRAAQKQSGAPGAPFSAALTHHKAGRLNEAARRYKQILQTHPAHADSLHMLGMVEHAQGRLDSAVALIRQAADLSNAAPCHFNLARALEDAGRLEEAAARYRKTIALWPGNADAHANLGNLLQGLGQLPEAAACFRQAIALEPGFAEAQTNLGNALRELGHLEEAIAQHRRALALAPDFAAAHVNLGVTLGRMGQGDEAIASYRRAITLQPNLADAHHNLAQALLARGEMAEGWAEYEWRWQTARMRGAGRDFPQPQWQGEEAPGRTLLIHAEQGLGDTLQFCRFVPLAAARGLRVILEVQEPLVRLLQQLPDAAQVVERGDALPPFDVHIPLLSLPRVFGTEMGTIPAAPAYLHADDVMAAHWCRRLGAGTGHRKIGLAWAGSPHLLADRQRSIPPDQLAPLFGMAGLDFFRLQQSGPAAPEAFGVTDVTAELTDLSITAGLIANLDLVISVDTAIAHLAAALGKPVWLMNRFDSCWRWHGSGTESPWYPGMRIYRQPRPGDWAAVISAIARDLEPGAPPLDPAGA
jgi:tetratricopeptide (TPR) repeat protein